KTWDESWKEVEKDLDPALVSVVAKSRLTLPEPYPPAAGVAPFGAESAPALTSPSSCPGSDSWDNGALDDIPRPPNYHSTIWTGSEMIVWGGYNGSPPLDTGWRYNPLTDTWTPTSMSGAPIPRYQHVAVWTGSQMVIWGGEPLFANVNGGRYS